VSSAIVDKYIGESARLIREMFGMLGNIKKTSNETVYNHLMEDTVGLNVY